MPRPSLCLAGALLLAALGSLPSAATTVTRLDTRGLAIGSDDIVIGEVEDAHSYWNPSHTKILTDVSVRVSRMLKGSAAQRITLTQLGGELDGMRYTVPGCAVFRPGEEALVFTWRDRQGRAQVNGLAQGKFEIRRDPSTGERTVQRALPGLSFRDARSLAALPEGVAPPSVSLDSMVREIERALAEAGR